MQDLELQLSALEELRNFIIQLQNDLSERLQAYNYRVRGLRESGLSIQVASTYESNFCEANNAAVGRLIDSLNEADLPYISRNIERIIEAIESSR